MKTAKIITVAAITIIISGNLFAGGESEVARTAIDAGGYINSSAEIGASVTGNENLASIAKSTETIADVSNALDVGVVGVTIATISTSSAPVIMQTLASAGAPLAGGVIVGAPIVAGGGALGVAATMNKHVFNGNTQADESARNSTCIAAVGATGATAVTLLTSGAGPTGIAAIGAEAITGGGMVAGATTLLAAPAVVVLVAGTGGYYLSKWLIGE